MRRGCWALLILLGSVSAGAQAAPAAAKPVGASPTPAAAISSVKLGESSIELNGPWKFRTGDNMAWAQTDLDDSSWADMDLTPQTGWTATGYKHYAGYAWYRLRVNLEGADRGLALKMPDQVDDAYQVFVNGQEIGSFGTFTPSHVTAYSTLPEEFHLPKGIRDGTITIAIRVWMDSATLFNSPDAGGLHGPPVIGYASVIGVLTQFDYDENARTLITGFVESMILFMALLLTLSLFWLDREEKAYFWLALVCLVTLLSNTIVISANFAAWIGQDLAVVVRDVILAPLRIGLWVIFWGYWFRLWRTARLQWLVWSVVGILVIGTAMLRPPLYGLHVPTHYASFINPVLLIAKLYLGVLLFFITYRGLARQKTGGWMAATAVILVFVANYQHEMRLIHVLRPFTVFSFLSLEVSLGTIATVVSLLMITVLLLMRYFDTQKLKEQWKLEIQQAQEVQQILIPSKLPEIPGLSIYSAYRPAREVGGDFFQVFPGDVPGSAVIIVGDVTGKGMQAGMLVATIVGALRNSAFHSWDPVQMMHEVNVQLCERQHASATCQILYIDPQGNTTLANAGQLPPYLNDKELEMEGALPLGTIPDAEHSVTTFVLHPGDALTLMSDGIVEAQDAHGRLFGFDRILELLENKQSAEQIATAAQEFGQEDDILVLQVRRNAT
jgi:Stage II sporulation protein E (SpoIIE)/Beta-galactosidase jelly roll domain